MKKLRWVVLAAISCALVAGCGSGDEAGRTVQLPLEPPREIDVTLDGYGGPGTVGILMAERRGYFEDVGLDVWVRLPGSRLSPLPYVAEREVGLSVSHLPEVVLARAKGVPVVAIGSLVPEPTAAVIWLKKSGIDEVSDLEGRKVGITGLPFERDLLESILEREGLTMDDVEVVAADYDLVPALVKGRVDAILGAANAEGAKLEARGLDPVIAPASDFGVPSYDELVLITRSDRLVKEPGTIQAFMTAVARGTAAAIEDPESATSVIERGIEADPDQGRAVTEAQVEATMPLLSRDGSLDTDQAEDLIEWMKEQGMIARVTSVDELLTNEFLAAQP